MDVETIGAYFFPIIVFSLISTIPLPFLYYFVIRRKKKPGQTIRNETPQEKEKKRYEGNKENRKAQKVEEIKDVIPESEEPSTLQQKKEPLMSESLSTFSNPFLGLRFSYPSIFKMQEKEKDRSKEYVFSSPKSRVILEFRALFFDSLPSVDELITQHIPQLQYRKMTLKDISESVRGYEDVVERELSIEHLFLIPFYDRWFILSYLYQETDDEQELEKENMNLLRFRESISFLYPPKSVGLVSSHRIVFQKDQFSIVLPSLHFHLTPIPSSSSSNIVFRFDTDSETTTKMVLLLKREDKSKIEELIKQQQQDKRKKRVSNIRISSISFNKNEHENEDEDSSSSSSSSSSLFSLYLFHKNDSFIYELPFLYNGEGYRYIFMMMKEKPERFEHDLIKKTMSEIRIIHQQQKKRKKNNKEEEKEEESQQLLILTSPKNEVVIHLPTNNIQRIQEFPELSNPMLRIQHNQEEISTLSTFTLQEQEEKDRFNSRENGFLEEMMIRRRKNQKEEVTNSRLKESIVKGDENQRKIQGIQLLGKEKKEYVTYVKRNDRIAILETLFHKRNAKINKEKIGFHETLNILDFSGGKTTVKKEKQQETQIKEG